MSCGSSVLYILFDTGETSKVLHFNVGKIKPIKVLDCVPSP